MNSCGEMTLGDDMGSPRMMASAPALISDFMKLIIVWVVSSKSSMIRSGEWRMLFAAPSIPRSCAAA